MIDDDFHPHRLQLRALGHLLLQAQSYPLMPAVREAELYRKVYMGGANPDEREAWLDELAAFNLVQIVDSGPRIGDRLGDLGADVCLTVAGSYYAISRADVFAENARTPTDDFPDEIVDAPWAFQVYYSPSDPNIPTADEKLKFDRDAENHRAAIRAIEKLAQGVRADNEFGDSEPETRDQILKELSKIRELLEEATGWRSQLIALSWATLGYLTANFADRPVGQLADDAWAAIQAII